MHIPKITVGATQAGQSGGQQDSLLNKENFSESDLTLLDTVLAHYQETRYQDEDNNEQLESGVLLEGDRPDTEEGQGGTEGL